MQVSRLAELSADDRATYLDRDAGVDAVRDDVESIVDRVHESGDEAVREYTREFDGIEIDRLDITARAAHAEEAVPDSVMAAIRTAASNIREFHERQTRSDWRVDFDGRELGRRFRPIASAGIYVPGGTAAYPSSALMGVIPARVAGVEHVAVATPPADDINPITLAAIHAAGADRVYAMGGAQAIAALAYGTETVAPVDKVAGPGNRWVTAAKAAVRGDVAIDFLAGPSELLVVADAKADPSAIAADLLAQAEHDPNAALVLVTPSRDLADAVVTQLDQQADRQDRESMIREALLNESSGILISEGLPEACRFADAFAPEHLAIHATNDEALLEQIDSAGSVFLGQYTPVAAGDYASGTNHILPTNGAARVTGGLSVDTFLRPSTVQRLTETALADLRETITTLASAEGLEAHAASIDQRFESS